MRAIAFYGDERIDWVERPDPEPGPGEIVIAPKAVGICGTDLKIYDGHFTYMQTGQGSYPIVPGHEFSGEVVAAGAGVDIPVGAQVVGECSIGCGACDWCAAGRYNICPRRTETGCLNRDGAMATHLLFPARSAHVLPVPLPWEQAALVEPTAVAYRGVRFGEPAGRTVVVLGAGPVGLQAAQAARSLGAAAVAVADVEPQRLATAERLGIEHRVALPAGTAEGGAAVRELFGDGADLVVECSGAPSAVGLAVEAVRNGGRIVQIGLSGRFDVPVYMDRVVTKEVTLVGSVSSPGVWPDVIGLVASAEIQTAPLVTDRFPFERVEDAIRCLRDRSPATVKVSLVA